MEKTIYSKARKELSQKLVTAREDAGYTQVQVEKLLGLRQSELSKLENGQRRLEFLVLLKLCELYDCPISYFTPSNFKD